MTNIEHKVDRIMGLFDLKIDTTEQQDFFLISLKQKEDHIDLQEMMRKRDKKRGKGKKFCFEKPLKVMQNFEDSSDPEIILDALNDLQKHITLDQIVDKL